MQENRWYRLSEYREATVRKVAVPTLLGSLVLLPGCATILTPTTQAVTINSEPVSAACAVKRDNHILGVVRTPFPVSVPRDPGHGDLIVGCVKPGYRSDLIRVAAVEDWGPSVMLGGLGGWGIDELSGAVYRYPGNVTVRMERGEE